MAVNPFEQQEARQKELDWIAKSVALAEQATEPPYADAKLGERHNVASELYKPASCTNRGLSIHNGPVQRLPSNPQASRDCHEWMRSDKQYSPYSYFESSQSKARFEEMKKNKKPASVYSETGSAVFFPMRRWDQRSPRKSRTEKDGDRKSEGGKSSKGEKSAQGTELGEGLGPPAEKAPASSEQEVKEKPRWDTEHHIMVSRMNHEVRPGEREYFDQPKAKESEAAPRIRQEYVMHDRQCKWNDEPTAEVSARRTCFHWVAPHNVGGPKVLQLPSYWRTVKDWRSMSEPGLQMSRTSSRTPAERKKHFLEAVADMPPDEAVRFWRGWSQHAKNRTSDKQHSHLFGSTKSLKKRDEGFLTETSTTTANTTTTASASSTAVSSQKKKDKDKKGSSKAAKTQRADWDDRWHVTHSKGNESFSAQHKQLFSTAGMLSGADFGNPDKFLTLKSQTWRGTAMMHA
mmetsp:Transcript_19585/g.45543  ORF Transcript_19585/g.45543 Transcript_19585/m.45543 type:complete len:460 (-) Transcript_19585:203-1582(-)|eukprot:CAMPEP_0178418656 /NCGR_PEP_ID=MMETSP0689_2-20121128/25203_1 /TAXON_ID=160604 /ORGANISM="Amphidinium massartii, Strain CS-259" /LENGTH=459 /DNA_ID=CAMNT_0020040061 /DNA_START=143 /DNA_END=1522 /DNA_ORIENTATION=+